ncbi:nucleolar protein 7 [Anolis carolinensis]|uniref:nucleolar protein 7 n=1 Tax=Anolis carolinensis TaxID=28377 RepID=UPI002F2B4039
MAGVEVQNPEGPTWPRPDLERSPKNLKLLGLAGTQTLSRRFRCLFGTSTPRSLSCLGLPSGFLGAEAYHAPPRKTTLFPSQPEAGVGKMAVRRTRASSRRESPAVVAAEEEEAGAVSPATGSSSEEGDDSSEEAPEEVAFVSAREAAEEERRLAAERHRREKAIIKEKRRQREELFKEQKKRKLLPASVLEELASSAQKSKEQLPDKTHQDQTAENKSESEHDSESENEKGDTKDDSEKEILQTRLQESYKAVRLKDESLTNKQQQVAKKFIQRHLYGEGSNRTTANQYFSVENKKSKVKKAAIQFVNNSWGETKKQKAKQFTKRWVSSKIIP